MNLRAIRRAVTLAWALTQCVLHYWVMRLCGHIPLERRAAWLHYSCLRILAALDIHCEVEGRPPTRGLVVANHLSYLDILILGAAMPCFFVAKHEIRGWPFFGKAARTGATIFIDRSSRASTAAVAAQMAERLNVDVPLLLFPEGTSTDGARVLRFHASLFEPAVAAGLPVTPAALRYVIRDGEERDLCWFGDAPFAPHLLKALGVEDFTARVHFGEPAIYPDRRTAAATTHAIITAMRGCEVPIGGNTQETDLSAMNDQSAARVKEGGNPQTCLEGAPVDPRTTRLVETRNSR